MTVGHSSSKRVEKRFRLAGTACLSLDTEACITYRIVTYYLDTSSGRYSMILPDSPRWRVRQYAASNCDFACVEKKGRNASGVVNKSRHLLRISASGWAALLPALATCGDLLPPSTSPLGALVPKGSGPDAPPAGTLYLSSLSFTRRSVLSLNGRLTVDSDFLPEIVPKGVCLCEFKTSVDAPDQTLPRGLVASAQPEATSKFAMLRALQSSAAYDAHPSR